VELDEELAKAKGIKSGDMVKVSSKTCHIKAVAVVTKRLKVLEVNDRKIHTVGIPHPWGFKGVAKNVYYRQHTDPVCGRREHPDP